MTKKEFTDYLFKIMYELGYRKAEVAKGGVFFYKCDTLMTVWTPRVPTECTCFADKWQCIDIGEYLDVVDWESVEVDTPILVGNDNKTWFKRYFAKYEDGKVYAWLNGKTSWSSTCEVSIGHWKYAKLAGDRA
jgi:hypothetical protein|nr:MAG TPA: hypothetical protein [Caudoviricetes sp.]